MARINLIYFGSVMDITGMTTESLDSPASLNELKVLLHERFSKLSTVTYRFSVNRQLANGDRQLVDGDEIALLPPFAGG